MGKRQRLEDLNVLDDFMLNAIANDPDVGEAFFREVLSVLLERDIGEIMVTFENTCKEYPDIENKDGLKYIYFNTTGTKGGTESIKQLLSYLKHSKIENVTNEKLSHIHDYVETVKQASEVRDRYMTIGEMLDASKEEGRVEGALDVYVSLVVDGVLSLAEAAERLGMTEEELKSRMC